MQLRAFSPADELGLTALMTGHPGWHGAAYHRQRHQGITSPGLRLVAVEAEQVVGYAEAIALPMLRGRRAPAVVFVDPNYRGRGVGRALCQQVLALLREQAVPGALLVARADDEATLALAAAHGLTDEGSHLESTLELAGLAPVSIATLPAPLDERAGRDLVYGLICELGEDTPDVGPGAGMPREVFDSLLREPWQGLISVDGDEVTGLIVGFARATPGEANIALIGVRRRWRGRGLAAPLMAAWGLSLREHGFRTLVTQNMTTNERILRANARLGFVVTGGYRDLAYDF